MATDIMATGFMGLAFEATAGTFLAPTKFFPIKSENLDYVQSTQWRRVIRGLADNIGGIQGNSNIAGDITVECLPDVIPYFLHASRNTFVKSGITPFTYTYTPYHGANPQAARTLSLTVVRNGVTFGYTGCIVHHLKFTCGNDGVLWATFSIVGRDEATQTLPTATFANQSPFGAGMYTIGVPTGSTVLDVDSFDINVNDNGKPEWRLAAVRTPQFVRFGQRDVSVTMKRDFQTRAEYDTFKTLTAQSIRIVAANGASANFQFTAAAAVKDPYNVNGLGNQGDIVAADLTWMGTYDTSTSKAYEIIVITTESIT